MSAHKLNYLTATAKVVCGTIKQCETFTSKFEHEQQDQCKETEKYARQL